MAVARAVYGDLVVLNLTLTATSHPNTTNVPKLITKLYKQAYRIINETYAAYDAGNENVIIDTEACKEIIVSETEEIVNIWHFSGKENPPPSAKMSEEGQAELKELMQHKRPRLVGIRIYGSDYDDIGVI